MKLFISTCTKSNTHYVPGNFILQEIIGNYNVWWCNLLSDSERSLFFPSFFLHDSNIMKWSMVEVKAYTLHEHS